MNDHHITKLDAARRQLDTAIRLFFDNEDSLSVHTLAYASFKILFDIYPLHKSDDFATKIDEMIRVMGWQRFNETANFVKHADRDPGELLRHHDAEGTETFIGLASLMYRRIAGDFTPLMRGFDCWTETQNPEVFDIPPDPDPEREALEKKMREAIKAAPLSERLAMGKQLTEMLTDMWERRHELGLADEDSAG
jgi:hypothetical protein